MPIRVAVVAFVVAFWMLPTQPAAARDWVSYSSANFTLYSDAREQDVLSMLETFELFRHTVLDVLGLPDVPESTRLVIVLYGQARDYARIRPTSNTVGFFYRQVTGPRMIVSARGRLESVRETLFHEYVHYLMDERSNANFPHWYSEGLATLLSSVEITRSHINVGRPPPEFWEVINAATEHTGMELTVQGLLSGTQIRHPMYYPRSWLLTHYLTLDNPARVAQTVEYLRRYSAGDQSVATFTEVFGMPPTAMNHELNRYTERRRLNVVQRPRIDYGGVLSRRTLDPEEASLLLASIAADISRYDVAAHYLADAQAAGEQSPHWLDIIANRAILHIHQRQVGEGDVLFEQLLEAAPDSPRLLADIAHYAFDRWVEIRAGRAQGSASTEIGRAIDFGERAVAADPRNLEALLYLGLAHEASGELQRAATTLLYGYQLSGRIGFLNNQLVRIMIRTGQPEHAITLMSRMASATHSEQQQARFSETIAALQDGTFDFERFDYLLPLWERNDG